MNATSIPAEPAAVVRRETFNNIVIGIVITVVVTWLLFRGEDATHALDSGGGVLGILPATFNVTFLITLGMTLGARHRVRSGRIRKPAAGEGLSITRFLPGNVVLRAVTLALTMLVLFVPATLLVVWGSIRLGLLPERWTMAGFMAFYIVYFIVLTKVITPIVIWRGLHD